MSILDITEDQIFQTLGKGKDPNFKQIEKERPVTTKKNKTYIVNNNPGNAKSKTLPAVNNSKPIEAPVQQVVISPPYTQSDETVKKLTEDLNELNNRVCSLHKMVKWYMVPQFIVVLVLLLVIVVKANP